MDDTILIRQETGQDFEEVREVVRRAFLGMEDSDHTEHELVDRLRRSAAFVPLLSLVAVAGERIVGHILLTEVEIGAETGGKSGRVLALAPLSVLPGFQRKGIGGALLREAHRRAAQAGYDGVVVLGHKDYYPRFGYVKASSFGIRFPFDAPDECCMALELREGGLEHVSGTVRYPDAFRG